MYMEKLLVAMIMMGQSKYHAELYLTLFIEFNHKECFAKIFSSQKLHSKLVYIVLMIEVL